MAELHGRSELASAVRLPVFPQDPPRRLDRVVGDRAENDPHGGKENQEPLEDRSSEHGECGGFLYGEALRSYLPEEEDENGHDGDGDPEEVSEENGDEEHARVAENMRGHPLAPPPLFHLGRRRTGYREIGGLRGGKERREEKKDREPYDEWKVLTDSVYAVHSAHADDAEPSGEVAARRRAREGVIA